MVLPARLFSILCLVALCLGGWSGGLAAASSSAGTEDTYPMRWRIFRDPVSATSFRFPYDYRMPDQYRGDLVRPGAGGGGQMAIRIDPKTAQDPKAIEALIKSMRTQGLDNPAVRHRFLAKADLPGNVDAADLAAILAILAEAQPTATEPFDYYGDVARRGHADPKWAPPGITALRATMPKGCAQIMAHEEGWSALILDGGIDAHDNRAILDTFEVLGVVKSGPRPTWREQQTTKGKKVFAADGSLVPFAKTDSVAWNQAWECETANYHITCSASPLTTASVGALMEALNVAFVGVFEPENLPPYKMEIHILPNVREFVRIAHAKGFGPIQDGSGGSLTGGFFVPSQLCIYTFEEPVRGFPTRMDKVLAHEASHQFLHVTCNGSDHVPTWINEGLAVYFESGEFKGGRFTWQPPKERIQQLNAHYAREKSTLIPLEDYFDHYGHIPAMCYAEVYALTHFWVWGAKGGKERFQNLWKALKAGEDGNAAFERIFMADIITAQGSRRQALNIMRELILDYVKKGGPLKVPSK